MTVNLYLIYIICSWLNESFVQNLSGQIERCSENIPRTTRKVKKIRHTSSLILDDEFTRNMSVLHILTKKPRQSICLYNFFIDYIWLRDLWMMTLLSARIFRMVSCAWQNVFLRYFAEISDSWGVYSRI